MKAIVQDHYGTTEQLRLAEVPTPSPAPARCSCASGPPASTAAPGT